MYAMSSRNFEHAIRMYDKAIELDPNYAIAYAGIADTYSQMFRFADATHKMPQKRWRPASTPSNWIRIRPRRTPPGVCHCLSMKSISGPRNILRPPCC